MLKKLIGISALAIILAPYTASAQGQYGFTHPPYSYDQEYRDNQWKCSEEHRYQPGYGRCSGDEWRRHRRDRDED